LTHHLVHDDAGWRFLERLFEATATHPAVRWLAAEAIFRPRGPARRDEAQLSQ
jgi:hypothetical protein